MQRFPGCLCGAAKKMLEQRGWKLTLLSVALAVGACSSNPSAQKKRNAVRTTYLTFDTPGLSPLEVEDQVSYPAATVVMAVPGVQSVRSLSRNNGSALAITFAKGTNVWANREALLAAPWTRAGLPDGVSPALYPATDPTTPAVHYILSSPTLDSAALRELQQSELRTPLLALPGVAAVTTCGGDAREVRIELDPQRAAAMGTDIHQAKRALDDRFSIGVLQVSAMNELPAVVIATTKLGAPVRLSDVATIRDTLRRARCIATRNSAAIIDVQVLTNTAAKNDVTKSVLRVLERLSPIIEANGGQLSYPSPEQLRVYMRAMAPSLTLGPRRINEAVERIAAAAGRQIAAIDGVQTVTTFIGSREGGITSRPGNTIELRVSTLSDASEIGRIIVSKLQQEFPGTDSAAVVLDKHGNPPQARSIRVLGPDLDELQRLASQVERAIGDAQNMKSIGTMGVRLQPVLTIRTNRRSAARYGITLADIVKAVRAATFGVEVGWIADGGHRTRVRLTVSGNKDAQGLRDLLVLSSSGTPVPLAQLADFAIHAAPSEILSENTRRYVSIQYLRPADTATQRALRDIVTSAVQLPAGYSITFGQPADPLLAP